MLWKGVLVLLTGCCFSGAADVARVLYVTHSAGFRHDSITVSIQQLQKAVTESGKLEVVATEDLGYITKDRLRDFRAIFFFTSGELPLTADQKTDLLDFVKQGGGFGGVHSATDTLYTWPEYSELIGARFDGHPWVQEVRVDTEDPENPIVKPSSPGFSITDEIYQFRDFSRERVRVLLTLDTTSVDMGKEGVNRTDKDFALAWTRMYGLGRVFYTALGHFESTWRDTRFQDMMVRALLWLTGQEDGIGTPQPPASPELRAVTSASGGGPLSSLNPGSFITIYGTALTPGGSNSTDFPALHNKLAGSTVLLNDTPLPILYASPLQVNAYVPEETPLGQAELRVTSAGRSSSVPLLVVTR